VGESPASCRRKITVPSNNETSPIAKTPTRAGVLPTAGSSNPLTLTADPRKATVRLASPNNHRLPTAAKLIVPRHQVDECWVKPMRPKISVVVNLLAWALMLGCSSTK